MIKAANFAGSKQQKFGVYHHLSKYDHGWDAPSGVDFCYNRCTYGCSTPGILGSDLRQASMSQTEFSESQGTAGSC